LVPRLPINTVVVLVTSYTSYSKMIAKIVSTFPDLHSKCSSHLVHPSLIWMASEIAECLSMETEGYYKTPLLYAVTRKVLNICWKLDSLDVANIMPVAGLHAPG